MKISYLPYNLCFGFIFIISSSFAQTKQISIKEKLYPEFSWESIPLYMHIRKNTAFSQNEIKYLAQFPLITLEKTTGSKTYGSTENGTLEAAKSIKKINPKSKILYYKNVVINWETYEEDEKFLKNNEDAYLKDKNGNKVYMPNKRTGFFDISQQKVQDYWINHVTEIVKSPFIDGLFFDANIKVLVPGFFNSKVGKDKQEEIKKGYFAMMDKTQKKLQDDNLLLANIIRVRPEFTDSGREFLKYFHGSYIEGFDNPDFGMSYADYLAKGIEAVQKSARDGNIIAMSLGLGEAQETQEYKTDDKREEIKSFDETNNRLNYLLAIFLICAEKYSYVYPHDGYNSLTSSIWMQKVPIYKYKLGAPKGPAIKKGYIYTREFEHLKVMLDIENRTAKLDWLN
ncbi:hypothetical protein PBAC_04130 [Pedobacter glucosidilyticus]|nr:hypothetical protein PBAC_04130 [Pedobacter glucosidilyticus]